MIAHRVWLMPVLAVAALAQQDSAMTREGKYWVQTQSGSSPLEGDMLKVVTRGAISLQGEARKNIAYTLRKRARPTAGAQAREDLARVIVKTLRQKGGWTVLEVVFPDSYAVAADLRLVVPRHLRKTVLESQGESIGAFDLDGSLHADSGGGQIQVDRVAGDVLVRTQGGQVRLGKIGKAVKCISGAGSITADSIGGEAYLNTAGGEIFVREARGPVHANTGGGNIRVERAESGVTASTGGGLIDVLEANGPVVAEAGNGSIKIRSANDVRCQSGNGTIQLHAVYGGLRASTAAGSILAELLGGKPFEDSALATGMGDITVYIPSKLAVTVQAVNSTPGIRRIVSDFEEIRPRIQQARSEAQGTINGGGPMLRLTASGGTIYLRRQK